jgi:hypothetical protein
VIDAPQVKVEDSGQLFARRQGQQLAAVFQATALNDLVKQLRRESGHGASEMRRLREPGEESPRVAGLLLRPVAGQPGLRGTPPSMRACGAEAAGGTAIVSGHGAPMIAASTAKNQS